MILINNTAKFYRVFTHQTLNGEHKNKFFKGGRKPRDTPIEIHNIVDVWFENKFSVKARSSCIFVGTTLSSVNKYAQHEHCEIKFVSFPPESKFIYSTQIEDLFQELEELEAFSPEFNKNTIYKFLEESNYKITSDPLSIPSDFEGELMVYCKNFTVCDI